MPKSNEIFETHYLLYIFIIYYGFQGLVLFMNYFLNYTEFFISHQLEAMTYVNVSKEKAHLTE